MNKEQFLDCLKLNGKLVTKRCTEAYLVKHDLIQYLDQLIDPSFGTISDRIRFLIHGGGYCLVCGIRTNVHVSGKGFGKYCNVHFHEPKKGKKAHNSIDVDKSQLWQLYVIEQKSLFQIAKILGNVSNVTLRKKLIEHDIPQRTHSENQRLHVNPKPKGFDFPKEWWIEQYKTKTSETIANELGCSPALVLQRLYAFDIPRITFLKDSIPELVIHEILKKNNVPFQTRVRGLLSNNQELDVFIPDCNLAIEVNGLYWHSELAGKGPKYHLNKTIQCDAKGIQLLQFWDSEIRDHPEIIESMILSKLKKTKRIFARKTVLTEIDYQTGKTFFERTHLQGNAAAPLFLGLFYDNQLVCCASFAKPRFSKNHDWELIRFASELNVTVIGGLSKIINKVTGTIVSYANRRWSKGNCYSALSMNLIGQTKPGYWYTKDFKHLENRMKFQKHLLEKTSVHFEPTLSESEIMQKSGYSKVWDCGNLIFQKLK